MFLQKSLLQEVNRLELLAWLELVCYGPDFFLHIDYRRMGILTFRFFKVQSNVEAGYCQISCVSLSLQHCRASQFSSFVINFFIFFIFFYGTLTQH